MASYLRNSDRLNYKAMKHLVTSVILTIVFIPILFAQADNNKRQVYLDIGHGQKFWNNPQEMVENAGGHLERAKYLKDQMEVTSAAVGASISYLKPEITAQKLDDCDLLFIHTPSAQYSKEEVDAIIKYVRNGGSLFLIMDADYWTDLEKTNVNDIVSPFGFQFGGNSADTLSGGHAKVGGPITKDPLKVIYHGARTLSGGTPFCFSNQSQEPFGAYKDLEDGGKIVVMGDGMVSLYMTSWAGVKDYPSQKFMQHVFKWLLE